MKMRAARWRGAGAGRRAFSLIEIVVSMAILSIVLGAIGSVILLASRAGPQSAGAVQTTSAAAAALGQMTGDLRYATKVVASSPTSITVEVADRTGDGDPETIRYAWAGKGQPIVRTINGVSVELVGAAEAFGLAYTTRKVSVTTTGEVVNDSGEVELAKFTGWSGLLASSLSKTASATTWLSQHFGMNPPAETESMRITKVRLRLRRPSGSGKTSTVGIHRPASPGSPEPAGAPVGTPVTVEMESLPGSIAWFDIPMSDDVAFAGRVTRLVIVVKGTLNGSVTQQYYNHALAPVDTPVFLWTSDSGATWSPLLLRHENDAPFYVYGSYTTKTTAETTVETYYLTGVRVSFAAEGSAAKFEGTALTLNEPEIAGP